MPKFFSRKNEKIICSHFFSLKNEKQSIIITSENLHNFLSKSISGFENWTKKMSKIENPFYFSAKSFTYTENLGFSTFIFKNNIDILALT